MAQSRLQKFASIFNRVEGFLRSGAMKYDDKPVWFDVYKRFPPVKEPIFLQPLPEAKIRPIFYHEDKIRAEFYRVFGSPGIIDLMTPSKIPLCDLFIEKYIEIARSAETDVEDVVLFNLTANRLREAGYRLRTYPGSDSDGLPEIESQDKRAEQIRERQKSSLNISNLMADE